MPALSLVFIVMILNLMSSQESGRYVNTIPRIYTAAEKTHATEYDYTLTHIDTVHSAPVVFLPRNRRTIVAQPGETILQLDWLTVPESITVRHQQEFLPSVYYRFNEKTGTLTITWPAAWSPEPREITVAWSYRPLPLPREHRYPLRVHTTPSEDGLGETATYQNTVPSGTISGLQGGGSITRGIAVGSNQDLSLESGLRFDLSGRLREDVYITASLTDRSTFIQPDGTTQNLRSFDQVYVRITTPQTEAQFGDIDASYTKSNIVHLSRRLQGGDIRIRHGQNGQSSATLAVVAGTFRVMKFNGQTGIQGPYRLTNTSGETFITIAAGTEKVYLDGQLLDRGEENDYIIDYSIGELYFTNRRILRNSHRIRVEYQYLGSGFTRTITAAQTDYSALAGGRLSLGATFIRQADNITFDDFTGLTADEIETLQQAGNFQGEINVSGVDSVGYRPDSPFILYTRTDTVLASTNYTIYRYDPMNTQSHFRVRFTQVGDGNGSYRRSSQGVNGIIYEWIGPGRGSYEPIRSIRPPGMQQVLALRAIARPVQGLSFSAQWGISQQQGNRYSTTGLDPSQKLQTGLQWDLEIAEEVQMRSWADLELRSADFVVFDPVRDVEFDRKWDIVDVNPSDEMRLQAGLGLQRGNNMDARWHYQHLSRDAQNGYRNDIHANILLFDRWDFRADAGQLMSKHDSLGTTSWYNANVNSGIQISLGGATLRPEYTLEAEYRKAVTGNGLLRGDSFSFIEHSPALLLAGEDTWQIGVRYAYRTESMVHSGTIIPASRAHAPELSVRLRSGTWLSSDNRLAYRRETITPLFIAEAGESGATGVSVRSSQDITILNGGLQTSILYDASTQVRSVFQETYLEVGPEFGQYVWVDLNNDGIPQIDEFFPEQTPGEGLYIQQLIPSDDLIPVIALQARWSITMEPQSYWSAPVFRGLRYSSQINLTEESETQNQEGIYLLRGESLRNETATIAGSLRWDQRLELFRHLREVDTEITASLSERLNRLSAGIETSYLQRYAIVSRYRFTRDLTGQMRMEWKESDRSSTDLAPRNYEITGWLAEPAMHFRSATNISSSLYLEFGARADRYQAPQVGVRYDKLRMEVNANVSRDIQISVKGEYRSMRLNADTGALAEFELTDGAGAGRSLLWLSQVRWTHNDTITTMFDYDGRTRASSRVIHRIRIRVTARF